MADDLDAFFDEVSDVEAKVKQEETASEQVDADDAAGAPPTKKLKPNLPRGVVVAAASGVKKLETIEQLSDNASSLHNATEKRQPDRLAPAVQPPPAAPLPPAAISNKQTHPASNKQPETQEATKNSKLTGNFTLFIGNIGAESTEVDLYNHFSEKYPSIHEAQIVRNADGESKGYGFVSFTQALECARAKREMDQSWLGARPIRIKKYIGHEQHDKQKGQKKKKNRR
ncbi:hypothetical protein MPSEU_001050500 [Mayamaea pseudoterrestris]|nr:hypothetical protein MPSEU_001050500 [Mayamaea pseudoterrestris]